MWGRYYRLRYMKVVKLIWFKIANWDTPAWISSPGDSKINYLVYICNNTGKTIASDINHKKHEFNCVDDAKNWCQKDFEEFIMSFIIKDEKDNKQQLDLF